MSIIRQQAITELLKAHPNGGPTLAEIDAYELGYNSRDEEVKALRGLLEQIYNAEEAITIQYAQNGWTYKRPVWFFSVKDILTKHPK